MRCAGCGTEFVGAHVCPVQTTVTGAPIKFNSFNYPSTYNGTIGKTFRCQHMQLSGAESVTCAICGELEPDGEI